MNTVPATASVVIVGAGPAGMTAGIALADAGVDVVLLDRLAEGANTSRAVVVHARTLEVLEPIGVTAQLLERGIVVPHFVMRDGDRVLARISFEGLPTEYPYTVMIGQESTEAILSARLEKAGARVHRHTEVTAATQDADGVTVEYTDAEGNPNSIRADWVIGADGMHSKIREAAGIGFTGATYPESFVLADVRMTWPDPRDEVSLHLSPEGATIIAPLPDPQPNRYRIVATVPDAPEHQDLAYVQGLVDDRRPGAHAKVEEIIWSSRFRVHHRVADHYRAGRILLAGDAAHVHSPAGGQGMNTGIQDAVVLGRLLAAVVEGAPAAGLDEYEQTRRPVALGVVSFTDRVTRMATLRPTPARMIRNLLISTATRVPAVRHTLAYQLAELANR
ncbi:FAD-dependent oxidoreductase [Nocardia seriolae]|uniref:Pentachlorophenol monooxygenase n=1 Tax=Nocardia seriolae TaxID=37332 RepID=A0ABC9YTF5_9NOCA|nr:FAD-dependent monooxygenase [Nocardia seriolae]BEK97316.1 NAD(P)/FAD-dependent oxidoreductase [Nocardia seriolae]GAM46531.1 pentachlorophenol 4-monooxygenase [Nocardia seriolae]GAP28488.1 pentachlorophenol monooxygenase [Nocardia seriolae]